MPHAGGFGPCNPHDLTLMIEASITMGNNYQGILHGGIISTMLGSLPVSWYSAFLGCWGPTIDLNVHFIRSAKVGQVVKPGYSLVKIIHGGRRSSKRSLYLIKKKLADDYIASAVI